MSSPEAFAAYFKANADDPVYVLLGVQGAGTNLLSRLLSRAFNLSVLHDQSLVVRVAGQLGKSPSAGDIERAFRSIRTAMFPGPLRRRLVKASVHKDDRLDGIDAYFRSVAPRTVDELARFVFAYCSFRTGHTGMAVKSDDLWEHISSLDRVLPNRRVVLLTRDFRDNVMSVIDKPFGPCHPALAAHYVGSRFAYYEREYQRLASSRHVRFEDLVAAPAVTIDRLGQSIGIAPTTGTEARLRSFPIRPGRIGRWRSLPRPHLDWCETILGRELVSYGYGLVTTAAVEMNRWDYLSAVAGDLPHRVPQKLRHVWRRLADTPRGKRRAP